MGIHGIILKRKKMIWMAIYELKHVTKCYGETHAVDDISFTIAKGEIVVILGPSGSGKSTMLNILSGIDQPTSGSIFFQGDDIGKFSEDELIKYRKDHLGFIFQSYNLISNLTVRENIELGYELSDKSVAIDSIIKTVGLAEHRTKFPYQLSGGQMQRVAIARAVVKNPNVLFCDEPTGALDEKTARQILKLLQNIHDKFQTTIIIVTHNPSVAKMANTVLRMNSGKIVEVIQNEHPIDANEIRW